MVRKHLDIWLAIPSANYTIAQQTLPVWREQGYKIALLVNRGKDHSMWPCYDMIVEARYLGWPSSVNQLCALLPGADIVVTGGDDTFPDRDMDAQQIGAMFVEKFPDLFGVMQPTGDKWGKVRDVAGSPWIGREFIRRSYMGNGPFWSGYWHYRADYELQIIAQKAGCFWQCGNITHMHWHWRRMKRTRHAYKRDTPRPSSEHDRRLFSEREDAGFPGSGFLDA